MTDFHQGDHICAVYESPDEQLKVLAGYIKNGLDAGERCLYIVDDRSAADVLDALDATGIDVRSAQANRRLALMTKRETYLRDGAFNPDQMIWVLAAMTDEAVAEGCSGLRITGEMTWALGSEAGCDRLLEYEDKLNQFFPTSRAHAICQYNATKFPAWITADVLRLHPFALVGDSLYRNPFYEPPHINGLPADDPRRVRHMLAQIVGQAPPVTRTVTEAE